MTTGDPTTNDTPAPLLAFSAGRSGRGESGGTARGADRVASRGDSATRRFEQIVERHERKVLRLARRLLGRAEDAEDAAQEAFLKLYGALDRLDPERPVMPYLYRTTVNVCRDMGRRRASSALDAADTVDLDRVPASQQPVAEGAGPAEAARLAEERRIAAAALRALPDKQRTALVLRDLHGLTTGQVAEVLEIAEVTVRSQISRARLKVKRFRDRMLGGTAGETRESRKESPS